MTLNQISVFLENKPGTIQLLTDVLAKNHINMRALSLAETSDFGIVRIIVDELDAASETLKNEGFIYTVPGKGSFVAPKNIELIKEENLRKIEEHIMRIKELSLSCSLTKDDVEEMLMLMWEE